MFDTILGLPVHALVVHATEVIVPTAALVVALAALWPSFRRWARFLPFGLALVGLVLVPVTVRSGEELRARIGESPLIQTHAGIARGLLPWVVFLFIVAAVLLWWNWDERATGGSRGVSGSRAPTWVALALSVAAVLAATGVTVQAVRIGHSGATAVWSGVIGSMSESPAGESGKG